MSTSLVAIDCEMVGGVHGESLAARVSIVNKHGQVLLDKYIKPSRPIADYRTYVSGIVPSDLRFAQSLAQVKLEVAQILSGRILIGHTLDKDLRALGLCHSMVRRRDLAYYPPFIRMYGNRRPSLKFLAWKLLGRRIQEGEHSSVEDARATMDIYLSVSKNWS